RFPAIQPYELEDLHINVDVLKEPEPIESAEQLDVKKYGVIVSKNGRRGLLLPDLEGVDTVEKQISIAKQKAGIDELDDDIHLERFEVIRHV
ncbi:MAG: AMMECR1 domain-containing protein, partial [Erysipelotrichaceae bacterium]|nr:AMMECR1 domain-containing protein [Erysipelotrichaceae bacterium]